MAAAPSSCVAFGDSPQDQHGQQHGADRLQRQHHAGQGRRQAWERHADQQPAQHLRREGQRQQVAVRGPARDEIELAQRQADQQRDQRGRQGGVEERPGRLAQVGIAVAQDQQERGVREAGGQPDHHAQLRVLAVGAGADDAGDERHAGQHQRDGERGPQGRGARAAAARRAPPRRRPACCRARLPGPRRPAGWCGDTAPGRWRRRSPASQAQRTCDGGPRAVGAAFGLRQHQQERQRVGATEHGGRGRRDVGQLAPGCR